MSFVFERDEKHQEVRKDVAGTLRFYPKLDGSGNIELDINTIDNHSVEIFDPAGRLITAAAGVTVYSDGVPGIARIEFSVPAIARLGENYFALLRYKPLTLTTQQVATLYFDVVLQPWGDSSVSLNDLMSRVANIRPRLEQQRLRLDPAIAGNNGTVETLASQHAYLAHQELFTMLRGRIAQDTVSSGGIKTRPSLICDRKVLHPLEVALTLKAVFQFDLSGGDTTLTSEAKALFKHWSEQADKLFAALPPLAYDVREDRAADAELVSVGRAVRARRVQG